MKPPSHYIKFLDLYLVRKVGTIRARKITRFLIGLIPTLGVLWFIGILSYNLVSDEPVYLVGYVFKFSFMIFLLLTFLSISYEFCWVHRCFIAYDYIVSLCVEYQIRTGFGDWLFAARVASLVVGVVLVIAFIKNNCWNDFVRKQREVR